MGSIPAVAAGEHGRAKRKNTLGGREFKVPGESESRQFRGRYTKQRARNCASEEKRSAASAIVWECVENCAKRDAYVAEVASGYLVIVCAEDKSALQILTNLP